MNDTEAENKLNPERVFDKDGNITLMARALGYVMARRNGCKPFVEKESEWAERASRNINPTKVAVAAKFIYADRYYNQQGGTMDFWDGLSQNRKKNCEACVAEIDAAR